MAPSTVFAYWRRDHRRQAPSSHPDSPLAVAPTASSADSGPPQLPQLPSTPTLSDTIIESAGLSDSLSHSPFTEHPPDVPKVDDSGSYGQNPRHSSANLPVPSPSSENHARPRSSPENGVKQGGFTAQSNHSQQSIPVHRPDHPEMNSYKPSSPWRRGFGKGILSHQADDHNKGGAPHGGTAGSGLRINTTAQGAGRSSTKESKPESISSRREGHNHDPPAEHIHQKSGKTKFHLLNPMSLLARRRSSQFLSSRQEELKFATQSVVPAIPDDYDPRIRGNIVHDFSAPRPRRNVPGKGSGQEPQAPESSSGAEQQKPRSEHSPVFKEHFGEDRKPLQIENKGYLQSELMTNSTLSDKDLSELPAFARKLPLRAPENESQPVEQTIEVPYPGPQPPSEHSPPHHPPKETPNAAQKAPGVPSRLKSDASRFSFDMGGVGSSVQEKLLEEKHKEKEAARRQQALLEHSSYSDFDEDDFDYDAMEDDGGIEEKIPGVNADADEDEFNSGVSGVVGTTQTSLFVPALPTIAASPVSPTGSHSGVLAKSQGSQGQVAGNATASDSTFLNQRRSSSDYGDEAGQKIGPGSESTRPAAAGNKKTKASQSIDDDDLYYDDGGFDELPADAGGGAFDESVFDDENSHLHQRKFYPGTRIPVGTEGLFPGPGHPEGPVESESSNNNSDLRHVPSLASEFRHDPLRFSGGEAPKATGGVLTEQNLEAFHNALARVAEEAAAGKGLLQRNMSVSETSLGQDSAAQTADSHPGLISDDSRLSHQTMGFDDVVDDFNYDDYDGYDDDPIIAEANAEALENDDEGFYGREFGFYAHAHGNCDAEPVHGGYFGPRGIEGINRSHSGRGNFREPSLTPITERSEWSTRDSIISLTTHGAAAAAQQSNPSLTSPGLAQLVDMGSLDDEMSLEALMRLRRGAFGGSNGSLRSSAGSLSPQVAPAASSNRCSFLSVPEDGPMLNTTAEGSSPLADSTGVLGGGHFVSSPLSDRESMPGSPTLTLHHPAGLRQGSTGEAGEAVRAAGTAAKASHSRNSSSASISYVQETSEDGSSKWVMERRRLSDSGEMEVYEREVLGEGRI